MVEYEIATAGFQQTLAAVVALGLAGICAHQAVNGRSTWYRIAMGVCVVAALTAFGAIFVLGSPA